MHASLAVTAAAGNGLHSGERRTELDSHTNTCVLGPGCRIVHETLRYVNVTPFTQTLGQMSHKPIVSGALAYNDPTTGEVIMLVIHQAIYIEELTNHLLCPMQLRMNDLSINEEPKFCLANPTDDTHAITIKHEDIRIPLSLNGVTSYFVTRKPSEEEWNSCRHIEMTYEAPECWNPHSKSYSAMENAMIDHQGNVGGTKSRYHDCNLCVLETAKQVAALTSAGHESARVLSDRISQCSSVLSDVSNTLNDDTFHAALCANVNVAYSSQSSHVSLKRKNLKTAKQLAK
jgi:hypothetical protein